MSKVGTTVMSLTESALASCWGIIVKVACPEIGVNKQYTILWNHTKIKKTISTIFEFKEYFAVSSFILSDI